jgi:hypothetical protein
MFAGRESECPFLNCGEDRTFDRIRCYVSKFGNYDATYGSLAAIIVIMLWMYLAGPPCWWVGRLTNSGIRTNRGKSGLDEISLAYR